MTKATIDIVSSVAEMNSHEYFSDVESPEFGLIDQVFIVEKATAQGRPAVYLCNKTEEGVIAVVTTGLILDGIAKATEGVDQKREEISEQQRIEIMIVTANALGVIDKDRLIKYIQNL